MKTNIGPKIKYIRERLGLTQAQFAKSLGYSDKSVIAHIEKGDADMTYMKIMYLLEKYKIDANELFEDEKTVRNIKVAQREGKSIVVYIHGLYGSYKEADNFDYLKDRFDVVGLDYEDGNPWELKEVIRTKFKELTENYKNIVVIANSIGAFYTYEYLSDFDIKQAFFISPVADMYQLIVGIMMSKDIHLQDLKEERVIVIDEKTSISYEFFKSLEHHNDNWNVPTEILYGEKDKVIYIEDIVEFLAKHPLSKLTIKRDSEHYMPTVEEKEFIKEWILRNIYKKESTIYRGSRTTFIPFVDK